MLGAQRPLLRGARRGSTASGLGKRCVARCRYTALPKHYRFGAFQQFVKATANPTDKKAKKEAKSKVPYRPSRAEPSRAEPVDRCKRVPHAAIDDALAFPYRPLRFHARTHSQAYSAPGRPARSAACVAVWL